MAYSSPPYSSYPPSPPPPGIHPFPPLRRFPSRLPKREDDSDEDSGHRYWPPPTSPRFISIKPGTWEHRGKEQRSPFSDDEDNEHEEKDMRRRMRRAWEVDQEMRKDRQKEQHRARLPMMRDADVVHREMMRDLSEARHKVWGEESDVDRVNEWVYGVKVKEREPQRQPQTPIVDRRPPREHVIECGYRGQWHAEEERGKAKGTWHGFQHECWEEEKGEWKHDVSYGSKWKKGERWIEVRESVKEEGRREVVMVRRRKPKRWMRSEAQNHCDSLIERRRCLEPDR
ncbi:hypothetical protein K504DRAFT_449191 [Pleomassaria siparia CBS 279.74]|uniref:Uncharacterized protein n=1 Tax=Pleomassaria siparia CBS 279.74 TaxID=1314801 RepID=A0A6G1JVX6_9PLEO|nr:hypothetical protein K504DRAFT_449191 [Pleomassaria siparia CBS 279.74]